MKEVRGWKMRDRDLLDPIPLEVGDRLDYWEGRFNQTLRHRNVHLETQMPFIAAP